jgi:copper transport protein
VLRRLALLIIAAVPLAFLIMVAGSPTAAAHAALVSSDPLDGARLDRAPDRVTLRFDEPVQIVAGATRVISTAGGRADTGQPTPGDGGRSVIITLRGDLGHRPASYLVGYRVVSADGHVVAGSVRFGVRQDPQAISGAPTTGAGPPGVVSAIGTGLAYAGAVGAVGCIAAGLLVWPSALRSDRLRPVIIGGSVLIMIGTLAQIIAAGPAADGTGWAGLLRPEELPFTLIGDQGRLLAARFTLAAVLIPLGVAVRPARGEPDRVLLGSWLVAAVALLGTIAATGHGFTGSEQWLALIATMGHLAGMAVWIGGLIGLLIVIRPRLATLPRSAGALIDRWSRLAFLSIAVLVLSGEYLAWRQVQPIEALWRTTYGITLLIKLGLAAIAVIIGWAGSRVAASRSDVRGTRRAVTTELIIMTLVVAAATVLTASPPAKDRYGPPVNLTAQYDHDQLKIRVESTRRGPQLITVTPASASDRTTRTTRLSGQLSSDDAGVAAVGVHFVADDGHWRSTDATAPLPGWWQLQLTISPATGPSYVTQVGYRVW